MEIIDHAPPVSVDEAEYIRLLGFPRGHVLEGRSAELAAWTRDWYAEHGRPWVYAREAGPVAVGPGHVSIEARTFHSARLEQVLRDAAAHGAVVVAVSAGPEIEAAAHEAWLGERPDEYFFLEMFGSAVVEHLAAAVGARLCAWAGPQAMAVLPHYSPGYPEWDIREQPALAALLDRQVLPGPIDVLESGMLRPKKALLAVFGLTRHVDRVRPLSGLIPCETCSFSPCQYRRAPFGRTAVPAANRERAGDRPAYGTSVKALSRWARERLTMVRREDGGVEAVFQYEGSTCSNMGRPIHVEYHVTLGPAADGFLIRSQVCRPARGHEGYQAMCEYIRRGEPFVTDIGGEAPLVGRPLADALTWRRPQLGPGCLCEDASRAHKWGLVMETIHYALNEAPDGQAHLVRSVTD